MMPNSVVRSDPAALRAFYDPATLARLGELADRHDPAGVLRRWQSGRLPGVSSSLGA